MGNVCTYYLLNITFEDLICLSIRRDIHRTIQVNVFKYIFFSVSDTDNLFDPGVRAKLPDWKIENNFCSCANKRTSSILPTLDCSTTTIKSCTFHKLETADQQLCNKARKKRDIHLSHEIEPNYDMMQTKKRVRILLNNINIGC